MTPNTASNGLLSVSISPHIKGKKTTSGIMADVLISLIPSAVAATVLFGTRVLLLILTGVLACMASEFLFNKITKRENTLSDLSAAVTGLILALNVPASLPLWQLVFGSVAAMCMVKGLFGGLGQNFANPAVTARILLFVSFPTAMTKVSECLLSSSDLVSGATPLSTLSAGAATPSLADLFLGKHSTSAVGETCILAILAGFVYLLVRRVISWHTPVCFVATVYLLTLAVTQDPVQSLAYTFSGGLIFGAVFMATDYATTPTSYLGKAVFGIGCGLITFLIRVYGAYPEGASLSILFMNILTPYVERLCRRRPFGAGGVKK